MAAVPLARGDVVYASLDGATGVEKKGRRPCVVIQNNAGNKVSPLTIVAPITDANQYKGYPMQVLIEASELGPGAKDSVVEGGHIRSIDRDARIDSKTGVWCHLSDDVMERIDNALRSSLAL